MLFLLKNKILYDCMFKLPNIEKILSEEDIDLEPYRCSTDNRIKKWMVQIEYHKNKPSRRLSYFNQIKTRYESFSKWYCSICDHQSNSARGFNYHLESKNHKIKCGKITSMFCPYCNEEIEEGTLQDHLEKKALCRDLRKKDLRKEYFKKQRERDIELYKMNVNDPDIWFDELKDEYNRRLLADDGWYRDDNVCLVKNELGLLVPLTKIDGYEEKILGLFPEKKEEKEQEPVDLIDMDVSTLTYDDILFLLETNEIEPHEYRYLYHKKKDYEKEREIEDNFISKIS